MRSFAYHAAALRFCLLSFFIVFLPMHKSDCAVLDFNDLARAQSVEQGLQYLPDRQLSLALVITAAIASSDSFRALSAQTIQFDAPLLRSQALLEPRLYASTSVVDQKLEPVNELRPSEFKTAVQTLGVEKSFLTGTRLAAELTHQKSKEVSNFQIEIPGSDPIDPSREYFESRVQLSIEQPLLRNFAGRSIRYQISASESAASALREQFTEDIESWFLGFTELYYDAWLAQAQVSASLSELGRRRELLDITKVRIERGSAQRPDLLQVQSALAQAQVQVDQRKKQLDSMWRALVINLNLPDHWAFFNAMDIPISTVSYLEKAKKLCGGEREDQLSVDSRPSAGPSARIRRMNHLSQQFEYQAKAARDTLRPQLNAFAKVTSNAIDEDSRGDTLSDSFKFDNNEVAFGLNFTMPLGFSQERSTMQEQLAQAKAQKYRARQEKGMWQVEWLNTCSALYRNESRFNRQQEIFQMQKERAQLERERFSIGRVNMNALLSAQDDTTAAELSLRSSQRELHLSIWQVIRQAGELPNMIEQFQKMVSR